MLGFPYRQGIQIEPVMTEHHTPTGKPETKRVLVERSGRLSSNVKLGGDGGCFTALECPFNQSIPASTAVRRIHPAGSNVSMQRLGYSEQPYW